MDGSNLLFNFLQSTWWLTAEMAPYLLLGFIIAGLLRVFFNEDWVRRHLGQKGLYQIFKAVVIGIPLPLCSCGVIPVAAGIRRQGGQRGAVAAFTAATPQTGVDSIAATVGMLGWVFAGVRIVIAFVNGIVAGLVVERWGGGEDEMPESVASCCDEEEGECCCSHEEEDQSRCCQNNGQEKGNVDPGFARRFASGLKFGLLTLPGDLFGALVVGLTLAGIISTLVPQDFFTSLPGGLFGVYLGMTLISVPLYVCSTGSIPMAFTFLNAGMSPGAVLIFLIAGPESNTATITALWKLIGPRGTIGYLASIIATSWLSAIALDLSGLGILVAREVHNHEMGVNLFQQVMAGILVVVLLYSQAGRFKRSG